MNLIQRMREGKVDMTEQERARITIVQSDPKDKKWVLPKANGVTVSYVKLREIVFDAKEFPAVPDYFHEKMNSYYNPPGYVIQEVEVLYTLVSSDTSRKNGDIKKALYFLEQAREKATNFHDEGFISSMNSEEVDEEKYFSMITNRVYWCLRNYMKSEPFMGLDSLKLPNAIRFAVENIFLKMNHTMEIRRVWRDGYKEGVSAQSEDTERIGRSETPKKRRAGLETIASRDWDGQYIELNYDT